MASKVAICNIALRALGEPKIVSLTDANPRARACDSAYDDVREAVLRDHPWNFATERASLAADTAAPAWGYSRQFTLPSDCLRLLGLEAGDIEHKVEGRKILTDASAPLSIKYIKNVDDSGQYDTLFAQAMGLYLAWSISELLTKSEKVKARVWGEYLQLRSAATAVDAQEGTPEQFHAGTFIAARM